MKLFTNRQKYLKGSLHYDLIEDQYEMCDDTVAVIVCENSELIIEELKGGSYWTMLNLDMFSSSDINECIDFLIERYMG